MKLSSPLRRLLQPSLGKMGLSGIALSLALLATMPLAPTPPLQSQVGAAADTVINSQAPVATKASYPAKGKRS